MQGCLVDGSSNDCSAVPGICMLSYSNDQLALVNQCRVLSFHSSDSIIQHVAIYVPLGPSYQVKGGWQELVPRPLRNSDNSNVDTLLANSHFVVLLSLT